MDLEDDEEVFDLATVGEYELLSNEDESVLIQDNCVVIQHRLTKAVKMLPVSDEVLQVLGLALVVDDEPSVITEPVDATETVKTLNQYPVKTRVPSNTPSPKKQDNNKTRFPSEVKQQSPVKKTKDITSTIKQESNEPLTLELDNELEEMDEEHLDLEELQEENCNENKLDSESDVTDVDMKQETNDGSITIVYTDNEEDELSLITKEIDSYKPKGPQKARESHRSSSDDENTPNSKKPLYWPSDMVNRFLDLYEAHAATVDGNALWKLLYKELCKEYPELKQWRVDCLKTKYFSLRRTFRKAKDNYQASGVLTRWPFYKRCRELFSNPYLSAKIRSVNIRTKRLREGDTTEYDTDTEPMTESKIARKHEVFDTDDDYDEEVENRTKEEQPWQGGWTLVLLEEYIKLKNRYDEPALWAHVLRAMRDRVGDLLWTDTQISRKFYQLSNAYRTHAGNPAAPGLLRAGVTDKKVIDRLKIALGVKEGAIDKEWPQQATSLLLDIYPDYKNLIKNRAEMHAFSRMATRIAQNVPKFKPTAAQVRYKLEAFRARYHDISATTPRAELAAVTWPWFEKCAELFSDGWEVWSRRNTHLLLDAFVEVQKRLPQSSSKFWVEVEKRMLQELPQSGVTGAQCEARLKRLLNKFRYLSAPIDGKLRRVSWHFMPRMREIFGGEQLPPWPKPAVEVLLSLYQQHLPKMTSVEDELVWKDISNTINAKSTGIKTTPKSCRERMLCLKEKYAKLMKEEDGGKSWPLYKQMSTIFSSYLWSKSNVELLLSVYSEHESRFSCGESPACVWDDVSTQFNALSASSCVSAPQCRTEMQVLRARYRALRQAGNSRQWPFYEKMQEIFGDEDDNNPKKTTNIQNDTQELPTIKTEDSPTIKTEDSPKIKSEDERSGSALDFDGEGDDDEGDQILKHYIERTNYKPDDDFSSAQSAEKAERFRNGDKKWSDPEVFTLLNLYQEFHPLFKDPLQRHRLAWRDLSVALKKANRLYTRSPFAIREKVKSLIRAYWSQKSGGRKQGLHPDWYQILDVILIKDEATQNGYDESADETAQNNVQASADLLQKLLEETKKKNALLAANKRWRDSYTKQKNRQHTEKMAVLKKILKVTTELLEHRGDVQDELTRQLEELLAS